MPAWFHSSEVTTAIHIFALVGLVCTLCTTVLIGAIAQDLARKWLRDAWEIHLQNRADRHHRRTVDRRIEVVVATSTQNLDEELEKLTGQRRD